MSANSNQTEEIDLGYLFKKIGDLFNRCVKILFQIISFFLKYKFIVLALIIIGFAYGYYKDSTAKKSYSNQGIVIPNFGSVDYLYNNIEHLNAKISSRDTLFLKKVLDTNFRKIKKIEIEPITDIYNLMTKSREQIDVFRILFQNQDLSDFVEDMTTSKYYKYHQINFNIVGDASSEKIVGDILNFWNSNEHYTKYASIYRENANFQVTENKNMIAQIDSIISSITSGNVKSTNPGVVISENTNLHFLIERKSELLDELLASEIRQADYDDAIKLVNMEYNIYTSSGISNKIKYPIQLVFLFSLIFFIRYSYKKLKEIAENN